MASKSVGQIVGTIGGAVIGFFAGGNVALGASIGGMVGGMIDPPKGPKVVGPRLDDLSFQSSTLGAPLARGYGTFPVLGNVIWLEGDQYREVTTTEQQGGKGGGGAEYETSKYYATFAISLLRVTDPAKTVALRRLWIGSTLVYDAGSGDLSSVIASNTGAHVNFTFYSGSNTQAPNPRWQADKGVNAVSGFPGRCYIVIEDLDLEPYSRSLAMAQVKAELNIGEPEIVVIEDSTPITKVDPYTGKSDYLRYVSTVLLAPNRVDTALMRKFDNVTYSYTEGINVWSNELAISNGFVRYSGSAVTGEDSGYLQIAQSDRLVVIAEKYIATVNIDRWLEIFEDGAIEPIVGNRFPVRDKLGAIALVDGGELFTLKDRVIGPILRYQGAELSQESVQTYVATTAGYSENYIFVVDYYYATTTNCRIQKVSRETLEVVSFVEFLADGRYAAITVVNDSLAYVVTGGGELWRTDGSAASLVGTWFSGIPLSPGRRNWFKVFEEFPPYAVFAQEDYTYETEDKLRTWIVRSSVGVHAATLAEIITAEAGLVGVSSSDLNLTALGTVGLYGIRAAGKMSPRSVIETTQPAIPFDVSMSGYQVRFVPRGGASVATIPESDLGATDGRENNSVLLPVSREMDSQLPSKVSIRYLDVDRDYDTGEQYADYPAPTANERTLDLPIVMTGGVAAGAADVLIQKDWLERSSFGPFTLPPTWGHLEAGDVVSVQHRGQQHDLRLTRIEYLPDGRLTCQGVRSSAQTFTSTALPQNPLVPGHSTVTLAGSSVPMLLDIPRVVDAQNVPGISFGLYGLSSGWPGATLVRSDDNGVTWGAAGSSNNKAKVFDCGAAIGASNGYGVDLYTRLTVTPRNAEHVPYSLSLTQFLSGANLAAYGAHGRWEIINFRTATDNMDGSYTLADLQRGMFGTERHSAAHGAGDILVLLGSAVGFSSLPTAAIGTTKLFRALTKNAALDSAPDNSLYYAATNLAPLSGVKINGGRHWETFDWTVTWSPRSRIPVELFSGFATPLGESSAVYEAEIWTSGFATLKRTFTGLTAAQFTYTGAQQIADFGDTQGTLHIRIYQISATTGRGAAFETTIDRYAFPDPYRLSVTALLHMNDTGLTDVRGSTVTKVGNVARSAVQSKFGGYSSIYDGTGDYLQIAASNKFDFGTGDFTVEAFVYIAANSAQDAWPERTAMIFSIGASGGVYQFTFSIQGSSTTTGTGLAVSAGSANYLSSNTISHGVWHHCAVCRYSGTTYILLDGARVWSASVFSGVAMGSSVNPAYLGGRPYPTNYNQYLNGYIDEVRVTKAARYKDATYVVPTAEFPNP